MTIDISPAAIEQMCDWLENGRIDLYLQDGGHVQVGFPKAMSLAAKMLRELHVRRERDRKTYEDALVKIQDRLAEVNTPNNTPDR